MMKKSESAKSKKSGDEIIEEKRVGIRKSEKNDRKAEKEKKKAGKDMKKAEKETKKVGKEKKKPEKGKGFMLLGIRKTNTDRINTIINRSILYIKFIPLSVYLLFKIIIFAI